MNQPFDPYAAPKAAVVGHAPMHGLTAGTPIDFTATQAIKGTWAVLKQRWKEIVPLYIVFGLVAGAIAAATMWPIFEQAFKNAAEGIMVGKPPVLTPSDIITASFGGFALFVFTAIAMPGLQRANLNAVSNQPIALSQLWSERQHALRYLGLMLWAALMVGLGVFTLYIFSFWWITATLPVWFLIIDKNRGVFEGIREAKELTVGRRGAMFVAYLLLLVVSLFIRIIPIVGLLASIPLSFLQQLLPAWMYAATQGTLSPEYEGQN